MMFTLKQLEKAHEKVKTGADFPQYIQDIKALGLARYEVMVENGETRYFNELGEWIASPGVYQALTIATKAAEENLKVYISAHQQGQSDFFTFCRQAADSGVYKWVMDIQKMQCSYLDINGRPILTEKIFVA